MIEITVSFRLSELSLCRAARLQLIAGLILGTAGLPSGWAQLQDASASSEIRIVSPIDGTKFEARANISVRIEGMDVPNVGHVIRLLENGNVFRSLVLDPLVPTMTQPVALDFTFEVDDLRPGRYIFVAMIDEVSSAPVTVIVKRRHGRHR